MAAAPPCGLLPASGAIGTSAGLLHTQSFCMTTKILALELVSSNGRILPQCLHESCSLPAAPH